MAVTTGNPSTGETSYSIQVKPAETTTYSVEVIDVQGCVVRTSFTVYVEDVRCGKNLDKVLMCKRGKGPGSKSGSICVEPASVPDEIVLIQVKDVVGRVVYSERVANPESRMNHSIELNGQGIYLVTVRGQYRTLVQQVTVVR